MLSTFSVLVSKYAVVFLGIVGEQISLEDQCTHWQLNSK
jgi:nitrite reductase/ring-hydroxylating ferredoxin subunit